MTRININNTPEVLKNYNHQYGKTIVKGVKNELVGPLNDAQIWWNLLCSIYTWFNSYGQNLKTSDEN